MNLISIFVRKTDAYKMEERPHTEMIPIGKDLPLLMQDTEELMQHSLETVVTAEIRSLQSVFAALEIPFPEDLEAVFMKRCRELHNEMGFY